MADGFSKRISKVKDSRIGRGLHRRVNRIEKTHDNALTFLKQDH